MWDILSYKTARKTSKTVKVISEGPRSQLEEALTG